MRSTNAPVGTSDVRYNFEVERGSLKRKLSNSECLEALSSMARNKSLGNDGFPEEVYLKFWRLLGDKT